MIAGLASVSQRTKVSIGGRRGNRLNDIESFAGTLFRGVKWSEGVVDLVFILDRQREFKV